MIRRPLIFCSLAVLAAGVGGVARFATAQSGGVVTNAPIDSAGTFEVGGIDVDVRGKTAEQAREDGWRIAQRKGWDKLSQRLTGKGGSLPDSTLNNIVAGIVIEREEIGPDRYIARLGVLFRRDKASSILGVAQRMTRSPPMLVIPLQWSAGTATTLERKTAWNQAWDRFRTGNSAIDYVRVSGTGPDPLLLNAGQADRRGRNWWRSTLDQYGASDVLVPEVRIERQWPGGPIIATFIAGHGPDNQEIDRFSLRVENSDGLGALLDEGVKRLDAIYQRALSNGALQRDSGLANRPPRIEETDDSQADVSQQAQPIPPLPSDTPSASASSVVNVQVDTPSVAAVTGAESAMRAIPGVRSAATSSLALGGVSVMRVSYDGTVSGLATALQARGWQVQQAGNTLRVRRGGGNGGRSSTGEGETPGNSSTG
ncbi:heavy-metal-associated domain-containing protein [Stakelama flava]|nr:heavy-metal-associated domain-containing protein [Stakelama flava]